MDDETSTRRLFKRSTFWPYDTVEEYHLRESFKAPREFECECCGRHRIFDKLASIGWQLEKYRFDMSDGNAVPPYWFCDACVIEMRKEASHG